MRPFVDLASPPRWANTKRLAVTAKQKVAPMQGQEVKKLTERIDDYDLRQKKLQICLKKKSIAHK